MAQINGNSEQHLRDSIKHLWWNLTDEEISYHEDMRDVFFLAVRKKYGLPRAEAENIIRNLVPAPYETAA
jgi:hypothetical protein